MLVLWIAAALISALAAGLMLRRAATASAAVALEDPALAVYRRQLTEVDDLAERGLLAPEERRSAHAEAARRLLSAADGAAGAWRDASGGRRVVLAVAALAPIAAVGVYLLVGSPTAPDQPYRTRVAGWLKADPTRLDAPQMAAVLQDIAAKHPGDVTPLLYLAHVQADAGDNFSAERNLQKALRMAPRRPDLWGYYGMLVAEDSNTDVLPDDAREALRKALSLDPTAPQPRYILARDKIASGDIEGGLADWRALYGELDPALPQRQALGDEIATVERTHALPTAAAPQPGATDPQQQAFIRSMVDRLAARLASAPDDPEGWARLIRSYGVLGDTGRRDAALARARALFADRPKDLATIQAAASSAP